eukprot:136966-Pyramimonas_sp.AAC.1
MAMPIPNQPDDPIRAITDISEEFVDAMGAERVAPPGYVALGAAALAPVGGDSAIDEHLGEFELADLQMPSRA